MKLSFDEKVKTKLENFGAGQLAFDYDHSLSADEAANSCDIITRFRVVAVDKVPESFDAEMDSELGKIAYKSEGERYLEQNMKLSANNLGVIELSADSGQLGSNVEIADLRA